ncbi:MULTISPECIES: PglL family O-oligosaccharyltransferase [Acinetobacter]|uniref:PglL family O-oligosaccharyltransferase n=1 Tax=Acinetobacter TaxID=469 RepID=UPI000CFFDECA|nr:O-antigen ligase family protein [Acinetobacter sp. MYb10]QLD61957.1 O-antigen ligase C-terminal domain-containing protein [Acinetobacter sp. MYb10]
MKAIPYILSAVLLLLAWLLPIHKMPWTTFGSEALTFLSALVLLSAFLNKDLKIPKPQVLILPVLAIPLIQWGFGEILYFSNALLCTAYIAMFWLMLVVGYNLAVGEKGQREQVFKLFCLVVFTGAMLSSFIAICQWLNINDYFSPLMNRLRENRPYANFAQPNNLATFMCMGVFACLYFYEKKILPNYILGPSTFIFLLTIALTQSRTAWVVCLFTLIYLTIKQFGQTKRFGFVKLLAWSGVFIALIACLPILNQWIAAVATQEVTQTSSAVERATSGYLRLDMWNQALVAISEKPWFGYGWNQTGMAQIAAFDLYPSHEWYKTAHNVILDLLIWNGIPIGGLIIVYVACWLYWLNKGIKDAVSIAAGLMVCAILIHALLEYPIHYAYFLLPLGFLLGIIQAQYSRLPTVNLKSSITVSIIVIGLVLVGVIYRDYILYRQQSVFVNKKTPLSASQQAVMNQDILLLTQFKERVWWIGLNPYTKMSDQQLQDMGRMVANLASAYDIQKYAQILAFNGKKVEAEHQLWILNTLHRQDKSYQDLLPVSVVGK